MAAMSDAPASSTIPSRVRHQGPPLPIPTLSWALLAVVAAALYPGVRPNQDAGTTLSNLQQSSTAMVAAMILVASAVPLLIWAAAVQQRLTALGVRVAGPTIGLVGAVLASVALVTSGLAGWTAALVAPLGDAPIAAAFSQLSYAAGGPLFAAGLGLAIAGVAVPVLILRFIPRGLAWAGLVLAVLGELSLVVLVLPALGPALPVVRFGGLIWLVWVSFLIPRTRARQAA